MRDQKGIVLQVEEKEVIVVTQEGDFIKIPMPAQRPSPGQQLAIPMHRPRRFRPYLAAAAAILLIFIISALRPLAIQPAAASVALDMTPSIELLVAKNNTVIEVKANNPEGEKLKQNINVKGLDIYQAVNMITAKAAAMNYFDTEGENLVQATVVPLTENGNAVNIDQEEIMRVIHDQMDGSQYDGYVVVNQTRKDTLEQARTEGMPVNRYMLLEQTRQQGIELSQEQLKSVPLSTLMDETHMDVEKAFPGGMYRMFGSGGMRGHMGGMGGMRGMGGSSLPEGTNNRADNNDRQSDSTQGINGLQPQASNMEQSAPPHQGMMQMRMGARWVQGDSLQK